MQLIQKTDYALRALIFLSLNNGNLSTVNDISRKFNISREHLVKVVGHLAKLNYVTTIRGNGGGIKINAATMELSLYDIIVQFESKLEVIDCEHLVCPIRGVCRLKLILNEASAAFTQVLKSYKLSDILPKTEHELIEISKRLNLGII